MISEHGEPGGVLTAFQRPVAEFSIYSDAACRRKRAGLACVIVQGGVVYARAADRVKIAATKSKSVWAELLATRMALSMVPTGSSVVAYSDLTSIGGFLFGLTSLKEDAAISLVCREINDELKSRLRGHAEYIPPDSRPDWYQECHIAARARMRGKISWAMPPKPY